MTEVDKQELQRLAGIPHLPTDLTYELRLAVSGDGPRAYDWSDKPHRLLWDACGALERAEERLRQAVLAERALERDEREAREFVEQPTSGYPLHEECVEDAIAAVRADLERARDWVSKSIVNEVE